MNEAQVRSPEPVREFHWWLNLWTWWIFSVIFVFLSALQWPNPLFERISALLSLFSPLGMLVFLTTGTGGGPAFLGFLGLFLTRGHPILAILVLLAGLLLSEKLGRRLDLKLWQRTIFNLSVLFILALMADLLIWGSWVSLETLLHGGVPEFLRSNFFNQPGGFH